MQPYRVILLLLGLSLWALSVSAAGTDPPRLLPVPSCGTGWSLDGKITFYDRETLSDRINGEAELYFPYGFELLAYGRYAEGDKGFDLDVYRMGSLLDAFGMYANYRPKGADPVPTGAEGAVTPAQLFFYQDRYFVRLQSTGTAAAGKTALVTCAQAVSRLLPAGPGKPSEKDLLAIPEVVKGSVQYSATSLLGYDFFRRGMMADAVIDGESARVFVVLEGTAADAANSFKAYRVYLQANGGVVQPSTNSGGGALTGVDPLYGRVLADQAGRCVFGMVRVKDAAAALPVMEKLRQRVAR